MSYTKDLRAYCLQNQGLIFDISKEYKEHFSFIPSHTYYKILSRLEEEKLINRISHGLYFIGNPDNLDEIIRDYYIENEHGMVVGYALFNKMGITAYMDDYIDVYSNLVKNDQKTIGKYVLSQFNLVPFTMIHQMNVTLLEMLEKQFTMKYIIRWKFDEVVAKFLTMYRDDCFEDIIKVHNYNYAAIATLDMLLQQANIKNNVLEIYKKYDPTYDAEKAFKVKVILPNR